MYSVIKRDGKVVDFDLSKIRDAIIQAFDACEKILTAHGEKEQSVAAYLLEHETMNAETFKTHMEN